MKSTIILIVFLSAVACTPPITDADYYIQDSGNISVYFCPYEDCEQILKDFLSSAGDLDCAFYDFNLMNVTPLLADARIVIDQDNQRKLNLSKKVIDSGYGLMHNKFCIADKSSVMAGSMNPTARGTRFNNNNLILINSTKIAELYAAEFEELWAQDKNAGSSFNNIMLGNIPVSVYFCPEDKCADKVIREISKAEKSIHFMTFSFTHAAIANAMLLKMKDGVVIKGVFEKSQISTHSVYEVLRFQGADVRIDSNPYNMHHKVFIIDNKTVITGSFNPSKNGDKANDENMLVIHDPSIASLFLKEFKRVYGE